MLARRLVLVFGLLAASGIVAAAVIVAVNSTPPSASQLATAREELAMERTRCEESPQELPPNTTPREFCRRTLRLEFFYHDARFHLSSLRDVFLGTSFILAVAGLLLSASFVGAEWHAGAMTTLLTWEPRRLRVFLTKLAAAGVVVFVLALVLQVLLGLALAAVAALRGTTAGADGSWLRSVTGVALRSATLATMAAAIGFAVAAIGRNTAAALGAAFAYLVVVERLVGALRPHWQRWLIGENSVLFLTGRKNAVIEGGTALARSTMSAVVVLTLYTLAIVVVSFASFRQRDVT
jgi:ABC-2 type transport system permease protein